MGCGASAGDTDQKTDNSVADKHGALVYFDWSQCEFDVVMPDLLKGNIDEKDFYDFMWTVNYELLEEFSNKFKEDPAASVAKGALKTVVKKGVENTVGKFFLPAKIVFKGVETVTDAIRVKVRTKEWEETVVPALKAYFEEVNKAVKNTGLNFQVTYKIARLDPAELSELKAKRKAASAALMTRQMTDKLEETGHTRLQEFAAAFRAKTEMAKDKLDEVGEKLNEAKDTVKEKAESKLTAERVGKVEDKMSTEVPCITFTTVLSS